MENISNHQSDAARPAAAPPVYTPGAAATAEKAPREYTPAMRYMLPVCLAIGAVFVFFVWPKHAPAGITAAFAVLWGIYLAGFYALSWKTSSKSREGWFLLAAVALLFLRAAIYRAEGMAYVNIVVIPMLLMLHAVVCTLGSAVPAELEGQYLRLYLAGWFSYPFKCAARFFGAIGSMFAGAQKKAALIGVLCAVPLLIVVLSLLVSADSVMGYYVERLFAGGSGLFARVAFALLTAVLFYSFLYSALYEPARVSSAPAAQRLPALSARIVIALLLAAYALFAYFQFAYLTGLKGLPSGITYSEYAVSGFSQLCAVAAINLAVYSAVLTLSPDAPGKKPLLALLLAATCVVLYSGIMRLCLYIGAYGLTLNRILPMWFMAFLCLAVAMCFIKLFAPKLRLLRLCAATLIIWYIALNLLNLDAIVAKSILARAEAAGSLSRTDASYIARSLSADADGVIADSPYAEQIAQARIDSGNAN